MLKLVSKEFKKSEFHPVNEFVIKKLKVPDLFKVRDRFEGNQFLINTLTKYMFFYTIFDYLDLDLKGKIKIGFINTISFDNFFGVPITFIETKEYLKSCSFNDDDLFVFVNIDRKLCEIYGKVECKSRVIDSVSKNLDKYGAIIFL